MTTYVRRQVLATDAVIDRQLLIDQLQSQVAWLGMLGQLRDAVLDQDWERATKLAGRRITYPQPYPDD